MNIELTNLEYRRLLDMVYIGNWILNSIRGNDRFYDYDVVESKIFSYCHENKMDALVTDTPSTLVVPVLVIIYTTPPRVTVAEPAP